MDNKLKVPPIAKERLTSPEELAAKLGKLIGMNFPLTGKSSSFRKIVQLKNRLWHNSC